MFFTPFRHFRLLIYVEVFLCNGITMKILIDTNVLFSALIFPNSKPAKALEMANRNHILFLTTQNITEFLEIIDKKSPGNSIYAREFIYELSYILIPTDNEDEETIRDKDDQGILNAAIHNDVDIIITGDKDFLAMNLLCPLCLTPAQFLLFEEKSHNGGMAIDADS